MRRQIVAVALVILAAACRLGEGLALRNDLMKHFGEHDVEISENLSRREISIRFFDSPIRSAPREAKQVRAEEVAEFVTSHYRHPVTSVITVFATRTANGWNGQSVVVKIAKQR